MLAVGPKPSTTQAGRATDQRTASMMPGTMKSRNPTASMGRSAELTKGHRWKIFGVYLLIMIIAAIFLGIIGTLVAGLFGSPFSAAALERGIGIGTLLWLIVTAIYTAYFNIFVVMMYNDLRAAKEGIDTDQIAAVFD